MSKMIEALQRELASDRNAIFELERENENLIRIIKYLSDENSGLMAQLKYLNNENSKLVTQLETEVAKSENLASLINKDLEAPFKYDSQDLKRKVLGSAHKLERKVKEKKNNLDTLEQASGLQLSRILSSLSTSRTLQRPSLYKTLTQENSEEYKTNGLKSTCSLSLKKPLLIRSLSLPNMFPIPRMAQSSPPCPSSLLSVKSYFYDTEHLEFITDEVDIVTANEKCDDDWGFFSNGINIGKGGIFKGVRGLNFNLSKPSGDELEVNFANNQTFNAVG